MTSQVCYEVYRNLLHISFHRKVVADLHCIPSPWLYVIIMVTPKSFVEVVPCNWTGQYSNVGWIYRVYLKTIIGISSHSFTYKTDCPHKSDTQGLGIIRQKWSFLSLIALWYSLVFVSTIWLFQYMPKDHLQTDHTIGGEKQFKLSPKYFKISTKF